MRRMVELRSERASVERRSVETGAVIVEEIESGAAVGSQHLTVY
jgi:hypothetical protein